MNLKKAKGFLRKLKDEDLMYHLDDDAIDCLHESNNLITLKKAKAIQKTVDEIYEADLDWGKYDCPIGYCLHIMNFEGEPACLNG